MSKPVDSELVGARLIVWDTESGTSLYRSGFYGKPVGMAKPKPNQDFDAPLMLDLMEGLYLLEKRRLRVIDSKTRKKVTRTHLRKVAGKVYQGFDLAYKVYKHLRDRGYVVTPGIKFGADFAVYERGPGIDHAPFLVSVKQRHETMGTFEIVRAGRLATTVRKQFTIAVPNPRGEDVSFLVFSWFKA
jgi:tRNA-intron endonuclease